jgi:hypothetical protein
MRARLLAILPVVFLAGACGNDAPQKIVTVSLAKGEAKLEIEAEVAATPNARSTGLMGRTSLRDDAGMLFVYPGPVRVSFWMKDTVIPLDIAFISSGNVAEIRSMTPCAANPCPLTTPAAAYDWALEVNAGVFERAGITVGSAVRIDERLPTAA